MGEPVRKAVRDRILVDMLGGVQDTTGDGWRVLILDEFTTRMLSSALRMSDILDYNISVVEDLAKIREPLPQPAIYFIQPSSKSVARLLEDFGGPDGSQPVKGAGGRGPGGPTKHLYPSVHIFFSSKAKPAALEKIKGNERLMKRLKTLKELNVEFLTVDSRTMTTDHPAVAERMLSDECETNPTSITRAIDAVCSRLVTLFAALNDFPAIRYKANKSASASVSGDSPGQGLRGSLPQVMATQLLEKLSPMQRAGQLPAKESCELLVLDRSYDAVVPFIHDWGYEALAHDLIEFEGSNIYRYEVSEEGRGSVEHECVVDEHDELWVELRHLFFSEALKIVGARGQELTKSAKDVSIKAVLKALPKYTDRKALTSVHTSILTSITKTRAERDLDAVGMLEQEVVLGEKGSKEMLAYIKAHPDMDWHDKQRLLACYLATHPGRLDAATRGQWAKDVGLTPEDMSALCSGLARLGVKIMAGSAAEPKAKGLFSRDKSDKSGGGGTRQPRDGEVYDLERFAPLLYDVVEDLAGGRLSTEAYPYIRPPSADTTADAAAPSARTVLPGLNWARKKEGEAGGPGSPAVGGRRIVVFVLGGITRGEMRVAHQLSQKLGRDVVLGSTSVEKPRDFVDLLHHVAQLPEGE